MNCKVRKWMLIVVAVATLLMAPLSVLADSHAGIANTVPQTLTAQAYKAQADGVIEGYVTDEDDNAVYNAYVSASGPGSFEAYTDNVGWYSISGLVGGPYAVTAYPPYGSSLVLRCTNAEVVGGETTTLDFVLPAGGEIDGWVTDEHGARVFDAHVSASAQYSGWGEAYTDNYGWYSIVGLTGDIYEVQVSPPYGANLLYGITTVQVTQGDTTELDFVLPAGGIIEGYVRDGDGWGVYNAGVEASGPGYGWASTDNEGYYSIAGLQQSETYAVTAHPPDESELLQSTATGVVVETDSTTTLNFVLLSPVQRTIAGKVTDNYGVGVSGLQVYASGPVWRQDYTDSSGNYSIDGLEIGSYNVTAYPYPSVNLVSSTATGVVVPADNTTTTQDFILQAGGIITGQVTDGEAGVYLAFVYAYSPASRGAYTDNVGNYSIVGLPTGSYYLEVSHSGGNLLPVSATPAVIQGATTTQNFVLPAGGIIQGHVTDEDGPVYMALVYASGPRNGYAYTDNVGNYSIDGLRTGSYSVAAYPPAGSVNRLTISTTGVAVVQGDPPTTLGDLVLPTGGIIEGYVTDGDGYGVYNALVYASGSAMATGAYTGEDGYYSIDGLRSDNYAVTVSPPYWANLLPDTDPTYVAVVQGDPPTTLDDLVLPWGGIIEGRVTETDEYGAGVYHAYIYAEGPEGAGYAYTDSDGYYSVVGLPSGNYTVTADPYGEVWLLSFSTTDVAVDEGYLTPLDFYLPWGGMIQGQVTRMTDKGGVTVPYARIDAYGSDDQGYAYADANGYYFVVGLQSGNYYVTATPLYEFNLIGGEADTVVTQSEVTTVDFVLGLPVPILIYPADGTFTSDNTPWLDWSDVTDPSGVHYQLQVDNNTDFSSPEVFKTWVSLSSTTLAELAQGVYYWRVRAVDDVGNPSDWSESWSLTVTPAVPTLVYPANWTKTKDNTPWLDWSDVSGDTPIHYQLQVDDSADFSSPEVYKTWVNLSSTTLPVLPDGLYYWRVRAVNGADVASNWSGARAFTIDTLAPPVPTLIYPVNGKVTRDNTPWLDWSNVTDVTGVRYQLQVDDNADFSSPVVYKTVSLSSTTLPVLPDGVYYWRVRAVDNAGNAGDWSGAWSITVDTAPPPMPTLTYPADGTSTADNTPWLDWTDVTDATAIHYQLQVDDNADFSSPVVNKTWVNLSSATLPVLPDGVYYWRVRAVDAAGNASDWTSGWSFAVATQKL